MLELCKALEVPTLLHDSECWTVKIKGWMGIEEAGMKLSRSAKGFGKADGINIKKCGQNWECSQ
jgi:hypothetical protein